MSESEPRRSVRSTKGQHKALDIGHPIESKRRRKAGKKLDDKQEGPEEEVIRCVCGATEQDGDPAEPWIACDRCAAWQHNVCMGMSVYSEDLPKDYFCEQCKPENHVELLDGIAKGEKPWEERRRVYEEEKASEKKKKGGRKAKAKRNSDAREDSVKVSPAPEPRKELKGAKRKSRADSEDHDMKPATQKRKTSEIDSIPAYTPPGDLAIHIADLTDGRQPPAKGIFKAITEVLGGLQKRGEFRPTTGAPVESMAERFALQIERAVHDEHQNPKEYAAQVRTLRFNLKENPDLCSRLLQGTLTPPMLAVMSSDELASRELQQKTAKMKAQAERQSILDSEDAAPRFRRTHKGEELIEKDSSNVANEDKPSTLRRQSNRESFGTASVKHIDTQPQRQTSGRASLHIDTQHEPRTDFDIKKVFSSVRSPSLSQHRRSSQIAPPSAGPGIDPEVDRLLRDDGTDSPPYSPTEESDPDVVWRGTINMSTVASLQATARHIGGVNLNSTIGLPWNTLIPKTLTVAGRIDEQIATEYLCSLRYSAPTDVVVASLDPATEAAKADFLALVDYFTARRRYGVVAEKGTGDVRDTYLVPVPAGTSSHPEFMLNLEDNFIPTSRTVPMLLLVVVYRNDEAAMEKLRGPNWAGQYDPHFPAASTPTPLPSNNSPWTPSMGISESSAISYHPSLPAHPSMTTGQSPHASFNQAVVRSPLLLAQSDSEATAREVLGPLASCPTAMFLMSQAAMMQKNEWLVVRTVFENQPQARDDLEFLRRELERYQEQYGAALPTRPSQTPVPIPRVPHTIPPRSNQAALPETQTKAGHII